jgi:predicted small lipoprotein YifL
LDGSVQQGSSILPGMVVRSSVFIIASLILTGCGLKGPLYLPDAKGQPVQSPPETEQEKKARSTNGGAPVPPAPTDTTPAPPPPGN